MGAVGLIPQNISIVKMILSLFFFCVCGIVTSSPVAEVKEDRGLVGDIAMGILVGKIQEMLGITTTPKPKPIIDGIAGLLGGEPTTTAAPPTDEEKLGLLQTLFSPSADTTTTTAAPDHHQVWRSPWRWAPWVF